MRQRGRAGGSLVATMSLLVAALCFSLSVLAAPRLDAVDTAELGIPLGHSSSVVSSIALSPDEKWILTGGWDEVARLWDAASGREIFRFDGHRFGVNAVAISADGSYAFTAGNDNIARIWSLKTGELTGTLFGHASAIQSIAVSEDGALLVTGGGLDPADMQSDCSVRIWDARTGGQLRQMQGHSKAVMAVRFSAAGKEVISASLDGTIRTWRVADGRELRRLAHGAAVRAIDVSRDGAWLVSGGGDYGAGVGEINAAKLWDLRSGSVIRRFIGHTRDVSTVALSADFRHVLTSSYDGTTRLWRNAPNPTFTPLTQRGWAQEGNRSAVFTADGSAVLTGGYDGVARRWNVQTQQLNMRFGGDVAVPRAIAVSPDRRFFATANHDGMVRLFELATGESTAWSVTDTDTLTSIAFSPDGRFLLVAIGAASGRAASPATAQLWDIGTRRSLTTYAGHSASIVSAVFSSNGIMIATASEDGTSRVYETASGKLIANLVHPARGVKAVAFSRDDKHLVTAARDNQFRLWEIVSNRQVWQVGGPSQVPNVMGSFFLPAASAVVFSRDGEKIFAGSEDSQVRVLSTKTGAITAQFSIGSAQVTSIELSEDESHLLLGIGTRGVRLMRSTDGGPVRDFIGHANRVKSASFISERVIVSSSTDGTTRLWQRDTGAELAAIVSFTHRESVVVDRDGRFDAQRGGESSLLYWVVGRETIELDQLKERFFVPGLLARRLAFEELPSVDSFRRVALHPRVEILGKPATDSNIVVRLSNRGGGIGPVRLKLNGKEIFEDARPPAFDPDAAQVDIPVSLERFNPRFRTERDNALEVQAFNKEGYLRSRGGTYFAAPETKPSAVQPKLWAIVVGVSSYSDPRKKIDLRFAAKDAADMAAALKLGGESLFGAENTQLVLLASGLGAASLPTRANLKAAFEGLRQAGPEDVVVVHLSGHGLLHEGEYYFPTNEATSLDISDPVIRADRTISGRDIAGWLKTDAEKQVVILDTCAAGAFETSLTVERSVPADQIRAIERLKDRAGLYVLMGAAADRVSYEATPYRQGLLTHAILKAMRGAKLREDKFVDVAPMLDYVVDEVAQLAKSVGGIQRPYVALAKEQTRSFDIGRLDRMAQERIPLRAPKALLLRPVLLNETVGADDLSLSDSLTEAIRAQDAGNDGEPSFVFVDAEQMAGAVKPTGLYTADARAVDVRLILTLNGVRKELKVNCAREANLAGCTSALMAAIQSETASM